MGEIASAMKQLRDVSAQLEELELREEELKKELADASDSIETERAYMDARQTAADLESELLDRERAQRIFRSGRDEHGNFYSLAAWMVLSIFLMMFE